jgi:hypothetical protein
VFKKIREYEPGYAFVPPAQINRYRLENKYKKVSKLMLKKIIPHLGSAASGFFAAVKSLSSNGFYWGETQLQSPYQINKHVSKFKIGGFRLLNVQKAA